MIRKALILTLLIASAGCAPIISKDVLKQVDKGITLDAVQREPERYTGKKILWAGIILSIENLEDATFIEVLQTKLYYDLSPTKTPVDAKGGRFIISYPGYLDSVIYSADKRITVAGVINGMEKRKIGKTDYSYPIVKPIEMRLFEPWSEMEYPRLPPPYYYPPYYDPYWPYYWPYYPWRYPYPP